LSNYNFVSLNLFVFVYVFVLQVGQNNPLLGCHHATGKTILDKRFRHPLALSSLSYVVCPALHVFLVSCFGLVLLFSALFLTNFLLSLPYFKTKGRQKTPQPSFGLFLKTPFNTKGWSIIPFLFPPYTLVCACLNLPLSFLN
jgi:hypothetical protein